jgi:hypothetical protein
MDDEDIVFGRMPVGGAGDPSEFDYASRDEANMTADEAEYLFAGDDAPSQELHPATESAFPVFTEALRQYAAAERPPRLVRVDTTQSFPDLVSDAAAREIERRLSRVEAAFAAHEADPFAHPHTHEGGKMHAASRADILGVQALEAARTPGEALNALPEVPLGLPDYAQGNVRCWLDGNCVVVAVCFAAADGTPRVATAASRPRMPAVSEDVLGAVATGVYTATGRRLARDIAGWAWRNHARDEVLGMGNGPVLAVSAGTQGTAPLNALVHVQKMADAGHPQARREMLMLRAASKWGDGQRVAAPLLAEVDRRVAADKPSLFERIARWFK